MENRFNLIDEDWIPIAQVGYVSLRRVFTDPNLTTLGGTSVEKIALMKLLLAIAQAAYTPEDDDEWLDDGYQGLAERCLNYLQQWHFAFYLYGERPFLQLPSVKKAEAKSLGTIINEVATGNTTCLTQYHNQKVLDDKQKALLLLTQMSLALGGKKTDNKVVLTPNYTGKTNPKGKPTTAKPGPGIAHMGLLHSFITGPTLQQTLWLNLFTHEQIAEIGLFEQGLGKAPWEAMPQGEDCETARSLKNSLMGRLIPLCRFCLLDGDVLHLTEGIAHFNYKERLYDPSITVKSVKGELKVVWTDPDRRPWRQLSALLGFIATEQGDGVCYQLKYTVPRASRTQIRYGVWSGGLRVSSNAGEQYVSGKDDALESSYQLPEGAGQDSWFKSYTQAIATLETHAKVLYSCANKYFDEQKKDGKAIASFAVQNFWQLCELQAQQLILCCRDQQVMQKLKRQFYGYLLQVYDQTCPNQTAKQLELWVKYHPYLGNNLKQEAIE